MKRSALVTSERKDEYPILIVDRFGLIGDNLLNRLKEESLVVYVSQKQPETADNVVHIPFLKKVPTIPDNTYSYIFVIDDDTKAIKDSIPVFIKKAKIDSAVFVFAAHMSKLNDQFIANIPNTYEKAKVVIYGDIFGKDVIYDTENIVNKFIFQASNYGKIEIPGDGTKETYPVFVDDVVSGIFEAVFGAQEQKNLFYLFPKHGVTYLSLAHMLQKVNPSIGIDFLKEKKAEQKNYVFSTLTVYLLGENYALEDRIKEIDIKQKKAGEQPEIKKVEYKEERRNIFFPTLWLVFCVAFFLLLPLLTTLGLSFIGLQSLNSAKTALEGNDVSKAQTSVYFANSAFSFARQTSGILYSESELIGRQGMVDKLNSDINTGANVSAAGIYMLDSYKYLLAAFAKNSSNPTENFINASNYLQNAIIIFEKEKAEGSPFSAIAQKINPFLTFVSNTIDIWPDLLGFNGKKTYLILFQNNMELRPGGGFIGSYGLLTLDNGQVSNFSINNVYDADGQLTGHVEPPFPIRRYLPSANWYMRDSNFNVDFINSASEAAYFLNIEKGQRVDGVIGVDVSFVKNILSAMGQVYVPDYNEYVNSNNLFQLTETHADKNSFPGSTQKQDFLRSLFTAMKSDLTSRKNISYIGLAESLGESIREKHVLFAFENPSIQNLFTVNGWSSSLWDDRTNADGTINDFLGINEANLGVNKDNYFIKRSVSQVVNIDSKGTVSESVTVAYKNTDTSGIWPGGIYKDYLRFILPLGTQLTDVKINGQVQTTISAVTDPQVYENKNFEAPKQLELYQYNQDGKSIFGFLTNVPVGALQTITIDYTLNNTVDVSQALVNYDLRYFKQPGTDSYPYDFSLTYPPGFRVVSSSDGSAENSRLSYSTNLNSDKEISIGLGQQ